MKAAVAAFNQEKALVGAFSVITNLRMELFEALLRTEEGVQRTVQDCDRAEYKLSNQSGHCSGHRTGHQHQVAEICHTHAGGAKCTLYHILYYISTWRISKIYNPKSQSATIRSLNVYF